MKENGGQLNTGEGGGAKRGPEGLKFQVSEGGFGFAKISFGL